VYYVAGKERRSIVTADGAEQQSFWCVDEEELCSPDAIVTCRQGKVRKEIRAPKHPAHLQRRWTAKSRDFSSVLFSLIGSLFQRPFVSKFFDRD
jgi:hypothetical protein